MWPWSDLVLWPVSPIRESCCPWTIGSERNAFRGICSCRLRLRGAQWEGDCTGCLLQPETAISFFYNRRIFEEVGLNPDRPPTTFAELDEISKKLYRVEDGGSHTDPVQLRLSAFASAALVALCGWRSIRLRRRLRDPFYGRESVGDHGFPAQLHKSARGRAPEHTRNTP